MKVCKLVRLVLLSCLVVVGSSVDMTLKTDYNDCVPDEAASFTKSFIASSLILCSAICLQERCDIMRYDNGRCYLQIGSSSRTFTRRFHNVNLRGSSEFNAARGKSGTASSVYSPPSKMVDGDLETHFHSTDPDTTPWVMIDLGEPVMVEKFVVKPTTAGDHHVRFKDIRLLVSLEPPSTPGDFSSFTNLGDIGQPPSSAPYYWTHTLSPNPKCYQYIAIYKYVAHPHPTYYLEIDELYVYTHRF